jgi:hypothetical protein
VDQADLQPFYCSASLRTMALRGELLETVAAVVVLAPAVSTAVAAEMVAGAVEVEGAAALAGLGRCSTHCGACPSAQLRRPHCAVMVAAGHRELQLSLELAVLTLSDTQH